MNKNRKKKLIRIVERVAVGLVVLDAVLYFAAVQPLRNMAQERLERANEKRLEIRNDEVKVRRLEWYKGSVPGTEKEISDFMTQQVQSKRRYFTRATRVIEELANHSGVEVSGFSYKADSVRGEPLDRMNITMIVKGTFPGLMSFAHGLETTSSEFFVIHDFTFDTPEGANIALRLSADLYLTP